MLRKDDEPIPGYQLQRFLGRGQYGEVWKATAPGGAGVALKFIALDARHGLKEFQAIQRVKEVRHAHLMPITALWLIDDFGNVMNDRAMDDFEAQPPSARETLTGTNMRPEDIPGTPQMLVVAMLLGDNNLQDELNQYKQTGAKGIPVELLIQYMDEAARGIDFLNSTRHDLGDGPASIQHCDIKPANIILMGDSIVVCDFGLARTLGDGTATATGMVGSPAYMAPECVGRRPSKASDQYSLAISYYELRTGDLPFTNQTYTAVIDAHRSGNLEFSNVDEAEVAILRKATALNPSDRFETATDFAAALRDAVTSTRESRQVRTVLPLIPLILAGIAIVFASVFIVNAVVVGKPATQLVRFQVSPADARVRVNDTDVAATADGWFEFRVPVSGTVAVEVSRDPHYHSLKTSYDAAQLAGLEQPISLDPNGAFYVDRANKSFATSDAEKAAVDLVEAIKRGNDTWVTSHSMFDQKTPCISLTAASNSMRHFVWAGFTKGGAGRWQWQKNSTPARQVNTDDMEVEFVIAARNGRWFGVATLAGLNIWPSESNSASPLVQLPADADLLSATFHLTEDRVAIGDADGNVRVYEISADKPASLKLEKIVEQQTVNVLLPTDRVVAIGIDGAVSVWKTEGVESEPVVFELGYEPSFAIANGNQIISGAANADLSNQLFPIRIHNLDGQVISSLRGHQDVILDAKLVGSNLLVTGSESGKVGLWNLSETDEYAFVDFPSSITSVDATENGRWIVVGLNDGKVGLIDRESENYATVFPGHDKTVSDVVFVGEEYLFSADFSGTVRVWSLPRMVVLSNARKKLGQILSHDPAI